VCKFGSVCACLELFYTEQAHVRNLKVMQQLFYQPMRDDPAIPADFVALLFPNIDDMIDLHGELLFSRHRIIMSYDTMVYAKTLMAR